MNRYVVVVTGSRHWTDVDAIRARLIEYPSGSTVLFHGECPYGGADEIADRLGRAGGLDVRARPALKGETFPQRNTRMVAEAAALARETGAEFVCEAFPLLGSRGTWDTVNKFRRECDEGVTVTEVANAEQP